MKSTRTPWIARDEIRSLMATVATIVAGVIAIAIAANLESVPSAGRTLMVLMVAWSVFSFTFVIATMAAFAGRDHRRLGSALTHQARARWLEFTMGVGGPTSWVVQASLMAIIATLFSLMQPERSPVLQVVAFVCAISCWVLVAVVQAVAYARLHIIGNARGVAGLRTPERAGGLVFEQAEPTRFGDYLSMSFALQASLNTPAVSVQGRVARNLVTQHVVVAFIFNTIILAVLVAVLLANVGS